MKEIKEILEKVATFGPDDRAVLATVIDVQGSGYRLPGARMLMLQNGDTFGMVSGGCLEADVLERAKKVLTSGRSEVFTYDTRNEEDSVFSLNMGCRGVIRILLEPVDRKSVLIAHLRGVREDRKERTIATLISSDVRSNVELGGRVFCEGEGNLTTDNLPASLENLESLRSECVNFYESGGAYDFRTIETPEGSFEFAFESINPPISLVLFGAGADAIPLARIASDLGWQISVFDHRPAFLTKERFAEADRLIMHNDENPIETIHGDKRTVAVIMTHNYEKDSRVLPLLLASNVAYIAALGPKRRTDQLLSEAAANGNSFTPEQLDRLYAPAGLDIGADTPEAIALSIAAEIQSVLKARGAGHLRDRKGSIYDRK
jgi:xanthine/CO dehydrogenase XdhC/CoxF family maturation factor